jgi:hypothetical protein
MSRDMIIIQAYLKKNESHLKSIRAWITFFGVIVILGIIVGALIAIGALFLTAAVI